MVWKAGKGNTDHEHYLWDGQSGCTSTDDGHSHEYNKNQPYTSPGGKDKHIHPVADHVGEEIETFRPLNLGRK